MKIMSVMAAQGDILLQKVDEIPEENLKAPTVEDNKFILAHSETGHHHFIAKDDGLTVYETSDPLVAYLKIEGGSVDGGGDIRSLIHDRSWDTHETIGIPPGLYKITRQREFTPEGWRRVAD